MEIIRGNEIIKYIDELGYFRIEIFKDFPYLYQGNMEYEKKYLSRYSNSSESILIVLKDQEKLVGVCTGIPLKDEDKEFIQPFQTDNIDEIFYIGEVMVREGYRGQGIGTKLLSTMLNLVDQSKFKTVCFYTVDREDNHPLQPPNYKSPESLWNRLEFFKDPVKIVYYPWQDINSTTETEKPMNVWIKQL